MRIRARYETWPNGFSHTRNAQVGGSNPPISSMKSGLPMRDKPLLIFSKIAQKAYNDYCLTTTIEKA
jgi:hypothetical protein